MTQKKYPAYKPSSTEWLGEVPSHWKVMRLRFILASDGVKIGPFGSALKYEYIKDQGIKIYGQEHVIKDDFSLGKKYIDSEKFAELETYELLSGDVIVTMMGTTGKCKVFPEGVERGIMDSHLTRLRTKLHEYLPQLLALIINDSHLIYSQIKWFSKGSIMEGLNSTIIKSLYIPIPPLEEQKQILKYITEKKEKIDSTIRQKERLIELLQEERTAIINQAVTRGLDRNVKMKDSGVGWLGDIPEHWVSSRLRYYIQVLTDFTANGSFASLAENVKYKDQPDYSRLIRLTDLREDLKNEQAIYVDEHGHKYLKKSELFGGELLIANVGAYAGLVCRMPFYNGKATLGPNMFLLKTSSGLTNEFAFYLLTSDFISTPLKISASSTAQPKLNKDNIREVQIVVPPVNEQHIIVEYLKTKLEILNKTLSETERQILLLKEYRTSLINEVVTGKRCVLDEQVSELLP